MEKIFKHEIKFYFILIKIKKKKKTGISTQIFIYFSFLKEISFPVNIIFILTFKSMNIEINRKKDKHLKVLISFSPHEYLDLKHFH